MAKTMPLFVWIDWQLRIDRISRRWLLLRQKQKLNKIHREYAFSPGGEQLTPWMGMHARGARAVCCQATLV